MDFRTDPPRHAPLVHKSSSTTALNGSNKSGNTRSGSGSSSSNHSGRSTVSVYGSLDITELPRDNAEVIQQQQLSAKALLYSSENAEDAENKHAQLSHERETCFRKFSSCRWVIGYMCCAARFSQSAIRQCIGMAVVCMTLQSAAGPEGSPSGQGGTSSGAGDGGGGSGNRTALAGGGDDEVRIAEFTWSPEFESLVLNAFNIGFFFSPILGGHIAGKFGGKRVVFVALLVGSLVTICLPLAARYNDILVFVLRVFAGIFLGAVDPAIQALWSRWAPKNEKAQLTTCSYTGLSLAGIATFFIAGHLCGIRLQNGWPFIFYFFGGFALMCTVPWLFLVYDSPDHHPRILDNEKMLISKGKGQVGSNKTLSTPWRRMLTSGPLWAIAVAHMTYTWVVSWIMAYLPKYLRDVMKFDVDEDGLYSSLPYVGRLISGFVASYLSDRVIRSGRLSTTRTRKLFQTVGCVSSALCTLAVGFVNHEQRALAVTLLVLAMTFQNVTSVAFRINHLDIAPRFAGVMMGMTVTAAMAFSLTGPPITAAIIREGTNEEWLCLFIIVASLNIIGAVVFEIFGSGEIQDWAQPPKTDYSPMPAVSVTTIDVHGPRADNPSAETPHIVLVRNDVHDDSSSSASDADTDGHAPPPTTCPGHVTASDITVISVEDGGQKVDRVSSAKAGKAEGREENGAGFQIISPVSPALDQVQRGGGTVPERNLLRKRMSMSDLQQVNLEGKVKQATSVTPALPSRGDAEVDILRNRPE